MRALSECQQILAHRFRKNLRRPFRQLSVLRLEVLWHEPAGNHQPEQVPLVCPLARRLLRSPALLSKSCQDCHHRNWRLASVTKDRSRQFEGRCGCLISYGTVQSNRVPLVTLVLQGRPTGGFNPNRQHRQRLRGVPAVTRQVFDNGVALLRLILDDLDAVAQSLNALQFFRRRCQEGERNLARLRRQLDQLQPGLGDSVPNLLPPLAQGRAQRIVQKMLAYVQQHYQRPLSLAEVAASLEMNADYLAHLFSRTAGVTFRHYLHQLRLAKASELLRDPCARVCEVASAVGFASADHFRHAFKAGVGVPPSVWRMELCLA